MKQYNYKPKVFVHGLNCGQIRSIEQHLDKMNLSYSVLPYREKAQIRPFEGDVIVVQNNFPEELKGIEDVLRIRCHSLHKMVPIILITEDLAPFVNDILVDVEALAILKLPFSSEYFANIYNQIVIHQNDITPELATELQVQQAIIRGDYVTACDLLLTIWLEREHSVAYLSKLAMVCMHLNDRLSAKNFLYRASLINSKSLLLKDLLAQLEKQRPQLDQTSLDQLAGVDTKLANYLFWGNTYHDKGRSDSSIAAYSKALYCSPLSSEAQKGFLQVSSISTNTEMARKILTNSPEAFHLARFCNIKGVALTHQGDYKSAERYYRNALHFLSDQTSIYKVLLNLGLCLKKQGYYFQAREMFKKSASMAPIGQNRAKELLSLVESKLEI